MSSNRSSVSLRSLDSSEGDYTTPIHPGLLTAPGDSHPTWDEFPNGRFGDARSPAYGDIDGYGVSLKIPVSVPSSSHFHSSRAFTSLRRHPVNSHRKLSNTGVTPSKIQIFRGSSPPISKGGYQPSPGPKKRSFRRRTPSDPIYSTSTSKNHGGPSDPNPP